MNIFPHSIEAEQGVLGCCILQPNCIPDVVTHIKGNLNAFYDYRHRVLMEEFIKMMDEGRPLDLITIKQRLEDKHILEGVGGLAYIAGLPDSIPSAANLTYYLDILSEKHTLRLLLELCSQVVAKAPEYTGTISELLAEVEADVFKVCHPDAKESTRKDSFVRISEKLERAHGGKGGLDGLPSGLHSIDRILGGLKGGTMNVIAARPGLGKSSLALGIAEHNAGMGTPVGIISMEMSSDELNLRSLCSISGVNSRHALAGTMREIEVARITSNISRLNKMPIHICDRSDMSILQLRSEGRSMVAKHGIKLMVVDYLQLVSGSSRHGRREDVDGISRGIKNMAKELGIPVIALAQLNRDIEREPGRRPRLADLRESGGIEQDADTVSFIYCPDETSIGDDGTLKVKFSTQKNRNGDVGECDLLFERQFTRFSCPSMIGG